MKLSFKTLVSLCAIYFLTSGLALAEPADVSINEKGCGLFDSIDAYGNIVYAPAENRHVVSANNENGNISYSCSTDLNRINESGRSEIYNQERVWELSGQTISCNVYGATTDDWHQVVSRSGKAKLICHFRD
jgi:hypothetical protein